MVNDNVISHFDFQIDKDFQETFLSKNDYQNKLEPKKSPFIVHFISYVC